jgi:hypothetical protein
MSELDGFLRRCYGIREFNNDPECVLRIAFGKAQRAVVLADMRVAPGEPVGMLHLWNEHLPPFPAECPDLHWAKTMQRRLRRSLRALAEYVLAEPAAWQLRAFCAGFSLPPNGRTDPLLQFGRRFGFEIVAPDLSLLGRCHALGQDFLQWGLTRAFNPAARRGLFCERRELWMSRRTLIERYAGRASPEAAGTP